MRCRGQTSGRANGSGHQEDSRELARLGLAARHVQQEVDMSLCHSLQLFAQLPAAAFVMASQMAGAAMANPQVRLLMLNTVVSDYNSPLLVMVSLHGSLSHDH